MSISSTYWGHPETLSVRLVCEIEEDEDRRREECWARFNEVEKKWGKTLDLLQKCIKGLMEDGRPAAVEIADMLSDAIGDAPQLAGLRAASEAESMDDLDAWERALDKAEGAQ